MHNYSLPSKSAKKDFIFNMFGSTANAGVSVILLIVVSYIAGELEAGIFSFCFSTAQMLYTVAAFEMRNVQVTDVKREFTFSDLLAFRLTTISIMLLVSVVFILVRGVTGTKAAVLFLLCVYMAMLALSDVFQGNLQLNGYLFLAGGGFGCEVLLAALMFIVALFFTRSIVASVFPMVVVIFLWVILYDIPFSKCLVPLRVTFRLRILKKLFLSTIPLFISVFLNQFAFNTPKYAIDTYLTEVDQAHYGYLVMPAFFINLLSVYVFQPQLVPLSQKWAKHDYPSFKRTVSLLYVWVGIATFISMLLGFMFGIPVLNILYNTRLDEYKHLFVILLLGGGFSAGGTLSCTMLAVIRKQKRAIIAYAITATLAIFLPSLLVSRIGFTGAVYSYLIEMVVLFSSLLIIFVFCVKKR